MSLISKLTPTNLETEKQKFFDKNFEYDPQFHYADNIKSQWLTQYGLPKQSLSHLAQRIVKQADANQSHGKQLALDENQMLNQGQVRRLIKQFLIMHNLIKRFQIVTDPNISSRATVTSSLIKLHPEAKFSQKGILSMLYHEIGTHVLRRINYEQQLWYKKKKKYGLTTNYLKTEEGLAVLHGHLPKDNKLAYHAALKYLAVTQAQILSFRDLFRWLEPYYHSPQRRWRLTVRLKRGLTDASQPGGFTKDLLYFAGFVQVWHWLKQHDFKVDDLYYGKLAIEDLKIAKKLNPNYQPILPSFYIVDKHQYQQQMMDIGKANFLFS